MASSTGNNTACLLLGPPAYSTCNSMANICVDASGGMERAFTPVIYSLFALGGLHTVNGFVKLADLGYDSVASLINCFAEKKLKIDEHTINSLLLQEVSVFDESSEKPKNLSSWKKAVKVWDSIFKVGNTFGVASLCLLTAVPLYEIISVFNTQCANANAVCPGFKADAIDDCNWANDWLIEVIKQIIQGGLPHFG